MLMGLAISPKALIPGMVGISGIIFLVVADQAFMDSRKNDFEVSMALSTLSCAATLRSIRFASTGGSLPRFRGLGVGSGAARDLSRLALMPTRRCPGRRREGRGGRCRDARGQAR